MAREGIRQLYHELLGNVPEFERLEMEQKSKIVRHLERGCYNVIIQKCKKSNHFYTRQWESNIFVKMYSNRCAAVGYYLEIDIIIKKILSNEWRPSDIAKMSIEQLAPDTIIKEQNIVQQRRQQTIKTKTSSLFACPRCHKRNHTYRQVQIGAGDEATTSMCTCQECNFNFRG